ALIPSTLRKLRAAIAILRLLPADAHAREHGSWCQQGSNVHCMQERRPTKPKRRCSATEKLDDQPKPVGTGGSGALAHHLPKQHGSVKPSSSCFGRACTRDGVMYYPKNEAT
ncbi:unnamed protein product, partial [Cladocopium goreaui]